MMLPAGLLGKRKRTGSCKSPSGTSLNASMNALPALLLLLLLLLFHKSQSGS
jgi:hypothetical protein